MLHFNYMNFAEYQTKAATTALYPNQGNNLYYPALGLGGETGEVLNKIKKVMRDHQGEVTDEFREILKQELGDLLLHVTLHSVMAEEKEAFTVNDLIKAATEKMIRRHPHVFAGTKVSGSHEVKANWEKLKMKESICEGWPTTGSEENKGRTCPGEYGSVSY